MNAQVNTGNTHSSTDSRIKTNKCRNALEIYGNFFVEAYSGHHHWDRCLDVAFFM